MLLGFFDIETIREATEYLRTIPETDRGVVTTWLWIEGLLMALYYVLLFATVFFLGRRIIPAMIAGYREARAEAI